MIKHSWPTAPNRDQALEAAYIFVEKFVKENWEEAANWAEMADLQRLSALLDHSLERYLTLLVEDAEMETMQKEGLWKRISLPSDLDEDLTLPQFAGDAYVLEDKEVFSFAIGFEQEVSPIRLEFRLHHDAGKGYWLKLARIFNHTDSPTK